MGSIVYFDIHEYVSGELFINVWIGLGDRMTNIIISILRDGLDMYYKYLTSNLSHVYEFINNDYRDTNRIHIDVDEYDDEISDTNCECNRYDFYNPNYGYCQHNYKNKCIIEVPTKLFRIEKNDHIDYHSLMTWQAKLNTEIKDCINITSTNVDKIHNKTEHWYNDVIC